MSESTEFVTLPLQVEIPNNIRDFNLGLMFRESLEENSGMLFIFDEAEKQSFHMTETRILLILLSLHTMVLSKASSI